MASRQFRSAESIAGERQTRDAVISLLARHGFAELREDRTQRGTAITQIIDGRSPEGEGIKLHVRLCWRRDGRNAREDSYSAAQLRAKLVDDDWQNTLDFIVDRAADAEISHALFVQGGRDGITMVAMVPIDQIPAIWQRQREVSEDVIARGHTGRWRKNHAENGSSPTIWLQDDRWPATHVVADVLWNWAGVVNVLALPTSEHKAFVDDSFDDLPIDPQRLGRDQGKRVKAVRSGYPRDPKVRAAVLERADGNCERLGCSESRPFAGFLDVHHILGVGLSDRVWSCVALCPNCHREAHFAPDRDAINRQLQEFAASFESQK
ncbi:MAG: HNH endonuclease [Qipengyuania pacifica]